MDFDLRRFAAPILRWNDRRPTLVFCGDSHLEAPKKAYAAGYFLGRRAVFVRVGGATALGLCNNGSKTQAAPIFRSALLPWRADVQPVFQLGEVDCGFAVWSRAARENTTVQEQVSRALLSYRGFLSEIVEAGYRNTLVVSTIPPTIEDNQVGGDVHHFRRRVGVKFSERAELTAYFNREMLAISNELNLTFVDLDRDFLDGHTGIVKSRFRNPDPTDHHLHPRRAGRIWAKRVAEKCR